MLRTAIGFLTLALALAACGDNITPAPTPTPGGSGVQTSVAGGMIAASQNYRIVSTVTSGDVNAASANHSVRGAVIGEGGAQ